MISGLKKLSCRHTAELFLTALTAAEIDVRGSNFIKFPILFKAVFYAHIVSRSLS